MRHKQRIWIIRFTAAIICALIYELIVDCAAAGAVVRIADDRGGRIGTYVERYSQLYNSHEPVVIDGLCASACTLVFMLPREQMCATPHAVLAFHQAFDIATARLSNGTTSPNVVPNRAATEYLFRYYPRPVHTWINMHGGMPPPWRILELKGRELSRYVPSCKPPGTLPPIH